MSLYKEISSLEQNSSLYNQAQDIINQKYLEKRGRKKLKFLQE